MKNCKICRSELGAVFGIREMMLGTRDEFGYGQCTACGTIQIIDVPDSIATYYPDFYYSFIQEIVTLRRLPLIKRLFNSFRIRRKYRKGNHQIFNYLKPLQILPSQKILDIGCGKGQLICEMFNLGFTHIEGVDKFINQEYDHGYGVKVYKKDLSELKPDSYDLLMMHHVFEHMDGPVEELRKCHALLKPGGHLMIRIPVVGKAWEDYKENWIQLDAPRHFFIHTTKSVNMLAEKAEFAVTDVVYDSSGFQFWGSELYTRDITLVDEESKVYRRPEDFFRQNELMEFEAAAVELNRRGQGDQAIFYLRKL